MAAVSVIVCCVAAALALAGPDMVQVDAVRGADMMLLLLLRMGADRRRGRVDVRVCTYVCGSGKNQFMRISQWRQKKRVSAPNVNQMQGSIMSPRVNGAR